MPWPANPGATQNKPLTSIRGIAALWVLGYHLSLWAPSSYRPFGRLFEGGETAVDVFFILSGFILSSAYKTVSWHSLPAFFRKRLTRVFPLHLAVMLAVGVGVALAPYLNIHLNGAGAHEWSTYPLVLMLLQPYFGKAGTWNGPSWSIAVELTCYLLFPVLRLIVHRVRTGPLLVVAVLLAFVESLLVARFGHHMNAPWSLARALVGFSLGMVTQKAATKPALGLFTSLLEIIVPCLIAMVIITGHLASVPALSAVLIACLAWDRGIVSTTFRLPVLYWLGTISFSLYLVQQPILLMLRDVARPIWARGAFPFRESTFGWTFALVCTSVILAASHVSYKWIEAPTRSLGRSKNEQPA